MVAGREVKDNGVNGGRCGWEGGSEDWSVG